MRIQLSFEFMIYVAITIASITASLSIYLYSDHALLASGASAINTAFAASIEAHMAYYSSTFYVVVPKGACRQIAGIPNSVHISDSLCNGSTGMVEVSLNRDLNGSYELSGS